MTTPAARILLVSGSFRAGSRTRSAVDIIAQAVEEAGGETRLFDLHAMALPMMDPDDKAQGELEAVKASRTAAKWANGFVLATPEYHGAMSGALKNWLDFHWQEYAGKLAAVVGVAGGPSADLSITSTKTSFSWCYGFTHPLHATLTGSDFEGAELIDSGKRERLQRIGWDMVRYAPLLNGAFEDAKTEGKGVKSGMAGRYIW